MKPLLQVISIAGLAVLCAAPLRAQATSGTVRGQIVDNVTRLPLGGVAVVIGTRGALSREDGLYTITGVPAGTDSVRARLIGYGPGSKTVTLVGGDTVTADFDLIPQAVHLASVVVVGYGQQRAGEVTTS